MESIYNNSLNDDNTVISFILNTFVKEDEKNSSIILAYIIYFTEVLEELFLSSAINRPDVKFMVNKINVVENTFRLQNKKIGFNAFCNLLNEIQNKDMYESKYLFLINI